ncbi:hypothetical protein CFHF_18080 [Caulobacter flavus]|uniref:MotA/TolQ/ExbB proton channel domain-containing protein n=2 Tax=Caulobacter flavus TaxID=1679497 RepID=A0A2N5CQB4_9CAUL|nr:hypothetical protein [Caulobacter flavus]AYV46277.1 hypothetical protein C1707_08415 [Caulobacter flavus]PLR09997.1 hypothetical protein CFHF_18080 [Caulobacter flavus]
MKSTLWPAGASARVLTFVKEIYSPALGLFIVAVQILLLVVCSVQQRAIDNLDQANTGKPMGFSEAQALLELNRSQIEDADEIARQRTALRATLMQIVDDGSATASDILQTGRRIRELARTTPAAWSCPMTNTPDLNVDQELELAQAVRNCAKAHPGDPDSPRLEKAMADHLHAIDTYRGLQFERDKNADTVNRELEALLEPNAKTDTTPQPVSYEALVSVFSEITSIRENLPLLAFALQLPPFCIQILLAISSGVFGSLLVTLILLVYPNNNFDISKSSEFSGRLALGGLISLCVYMVLGAGSTIIGGGFAGLQAGDINVMGFAFACVLAGAFSDRVAAWLSNNAKEIFKIDTDAKVTSQAGTAGAEPEGQVT